MNTKRKSNNSETSGDKRPRLSDYASEIFESEEPEALPENSGGETKESGSDRRGREKKERERKNIEEAAERKRQMILKRAVSNTKLCFANIGGKRVEKNGIIEFEGGETFGKWTKQKAEDNTGILKKTINNNINKKQKSRGKKGEFEGQKVMFIKAPVDTSDKIPCDHCDKHFSTKGDMVRHVRAKHPGILPPARENLRMPEEFETFMTPITKKQYGRIVKKVRDNIKSDITKCDQKQLMALVDRYEPWGSTNIGGAADKYYFTEQQILDSIDNNESLTIEDGRHNLINELGRTTTIKLAGRKVTFSWKYSVSEEDKIKLLAMNNRETYHKIARQHCVHMNKEGMFANENVTDDNGGLIKNGFEFEKHGGLFSISNDRIEDEYIVNGQTFHKLHYPDIENALENIRTVAFMANVRYKASTATIQEKVTDFENKSEEQRKEEFKKVWNNSRKCRHNSKVTPLYNHATNIWKHDKICQATFPNTSTEEGFKAYWQHMLVLLKKQEGLCAVAKIPMSLSSGPWKMSCDAIDPRLGHVPDNIRLICLYNNVTDFSKLNKDLTDTRPHSLITALHDEYWRIVRE